MGLAPKNSFIGRIGSFGAWFLTKNNVLLVEYEDMLGGCGRSRSSR